MAFRLRYIDGIKTPPTPSLFLGRMVHRGLEFYYRHRQLGLRLPDSRVTAYLKDGWEAAVSEEGVQSRDVAGPIHATHRKSLSIYLYETSKARQVVLTGLG